jgi:streptogramin lyase
VFIVRLQSLPRPRGFSRFGPAACRAVLAGIALALTGCGSGGTLPSGTQLSLSPGTLTFSSTFVGLTSTAQTLTVTNSGTTSVTISNIGITGDFSETTANCATLPSNTYCTISVNFAPTATGARTGTLSITSNASGSPQTVALTGTGATGTPAVTLSPASLSFGTVTTGTSSPAQIVTVTNSGTGVLMVSNIAISGDYTQTSNGCSSNLGINATCQIAVTFTPSAAGARTGTLTLTTNATGSPQTVALTGTGVAPVVYPGPAFQVIAQAGSQSIAGASVQIYTAGNTGKGSAGTALLSTAATTNASGVASIAANYNCPVSTSLVYLVVSGGAVAGAASPNPNIVFLSALGPCSGIASGTKFVVDEATTVAAVEALAQFYTVGGSIGATASNLTGLSNAFATASTLADPVAGTSPGSALPGNAVSPAPRVNSLANLLNACAALVTSTACSTLYSNTAQGTTPATNTLDAAFYLVTHPTSNVAALYTQSLSSTAYTPYLPGAPTDWTMFITYSGAGLSSPSGIAVDSKGYVWVASYFNAASKFTPTGAAVFPNGITGAGLYNSYGLAIDASDNVWIPNEQPFTASGIGSVTELNSSGVALSGSAGYISGGLDYPLQVAIDPNGTVWVVDYGDSYLTLLNPSGAPLSGTNGYTTPLFAFPVAVAVDANHYGWIVNEASNNVTKVAPDGSSFVNYNCCDLASGIAIDQGDNIWVADYFGDSVSLLTNSGTVISSNYTGGGSIDHPQGIAIDGAGSAWVANYRAPYLSELSGSTSKTPGTSLTPATGIGGDAGLLEAYALAIDASGNIWVSNLGSSTVTKFIGIAVPVKTPLSGLPKLP